MVRRCGTHARKMGQEVHVDTIEVLVKPGMRRAVEIGMIPAAAEGQITAMAACGVTDFLSTSYWVKSQ
jgi:hypothetical protein